MTDYSQLIPSPDELQPRQKDDPNAYEKWLKRTLRAIGEAIRKTQVTLRDGGTLEYSYPVERDMGRGYRLWQRHWQDIQIIVSSRGYDVKTHKGVNISGHSPVLSIRIKPANPPLSEPPPPRRNAGS